MFLDLHMKFTGQVFYTIACITQISRNSTWLYIDTPIYFMMADLVNSKFSDGTLFTSDCSIRVYCDASVMLLCLM